MAAQPRLGLLSEWGARLGSGNPSRFVASWKSLKKVGSGAEVYRRIRGGLRVHHLVCNFVARVDRWVLGFPRIRLLDSSLVAVRGHLANCSSFSA